MEPSAPGAIRTILYLFFNWGNRDFTGEMPGDVFVISKMM